MVRLTVVVDIGADVSTFREQLRTIDAQTLAPELFEIVLVGSVTDDDWAYVDAVCAYRTSVRSQPDTTVVDALTVGTGEFVMAVDPAQRLFPGALEHVHRRLDALEQGSSPEVDGLVGRQVSSGLVPVALWRDGAQVSSSDLHGECVVVGRRWKTVVDASGTLGVPDAELEVLSGYPLVRRITGSADAAPATGSLPVAASEWHGPDLVITLDGESSSVDDRELLLRLTDTSTGLQFVFLPERPESGETTFTIPVLIAGAGRPLPAGLWSFTLQHQDDGSPGAGIRPLVGPAGRPALVDGLAVVPCQVAGSLGLDVGCRREALIRVDDPETGAVTESAAGSLLRLDLPNLHLHGRPTVTGKIGLGSLLIPGAVVADRDGIHLEAMMTGVSDTVALTASFGGGAPKPVGLSLNIDGLGQMSLLRTPKASRPPKAAKPAAKAAPAAGPKKRKRRRKAPRQGVLADVRRAVPASLEPVVARLRRSRTARRVYRRLTHP